MRKIELLAPAKDVECGITAIKCGADAVYIGAHKFGARQAAGNSVEDIKQVVDFAHQYYSKVYVTLNTLLYDDELSAAEKLIYQLYKAGIDGLIVQDAGICELELPPLPLIASTQMDNCNAAKVKFLEDVGFSRVILARELTIEQIREIRNATTIELECFVQGALCVGASGRCYMSYALGGRSGNRGECAQPCRKLYSLKNKNGDILVENRHLLSLKDLSLSNYLKDLIEAGVSSFKIEGRLKDASYVGNVTGYYRGKLDEIFIRSELRAASSGKVDLGFTADLTKTFCRGFTDYGISGRSGKIAAIDSPKSIGQYIGEVSEAGRDFFVVDCGVELHNADGICFFDSRKNLQGTVVNKIENGRVYHQKMEGIYAGVKIYRNLDHLFLKQLKKMEACRKIALSIVLKDTDNGVVLCGEDCDGNKAEFEIAFVKEAAIKKDAALNTISTQIQKLGNSIFQCSEFRLATDGVYFFPVSVLNELKRGLVEKMIEVRETNRAVRKGGIVKNDVSYPQVSFDYTGNVLNEKAKQFYKRHGVKTIGAAAESGLDMTGKVVMSTKYCIRKELGLCEGRLSKEAEHLFLEDGDGRCFEIRFRCGNCGMEIILK